MKVIEGNKIEDVKVAIVCAKFNDFITKPMLKACVDELIKDNVADDSITVVWVPGAFEIPVAARRLAKTNDAVICLGCIIKGETDHYDLVAEGATQGIMDVSLSTETPIVFEVLAVDRVELAEKRIDKGADAAQVALEMISVLQQI